MNFTNINYYLVYGIQYIIYTNLLNTHYSSYIVLHVQWIYFNMLLFPQVPIDPIDNMIYTMIVVMAIPFPQNPFPALRARASTIGNDFINYYCLGIPLSLYYRTRSTDNNQQDVPHDDSNIMILIGKKKNKTTTTTRLRFDLCLLEYFGVVRLYKPLDERTIYTLPLQVQVPKYIYIYYNIDKPNTVSGK